MKAADFVGQAFARAGQARVVGTEELHIWGGQFSENSALAFLDAWQDALGRQMTWRMVEEVSDFYVQQVGPGDSTLPCEPFQLERLRLFGEDGDLEIRRDMADFHWRFIGEAAKTWPALDGETFPYQDFWKTPWPSPPVFREVEQSYYQWRLQDDRVTNTWSHGTGLPVEGVVLRQKHYLDNGRVAFVRYVGFMEEKHG
ncbi:MAG: hypothetical protein L0322_18700 [Chloroflexi bacterium]|nr:hypothetical protein [Chloroflexota bacterium]MCI0580859.1 hypothetical protein [Chloroflexota bacterium]